MVLDSLMYGSLNENPPNDTSNHLQYEVVAMTKDIYQHFNKRTGGNSVTTTKTKLKTVLYKDIAGFKAPRFRAQCRVPKLADMRGA